MPPIILLGMGLAMVLFGYVRMNIFPKINGNEVRSLHVAGVPLRAEVVQSKEKMQKGLGDRDGLCGDCAMLFVFSGQGKRSFWMNGMRFSLDIVWISDNTIVHIEKNIPPDTEKIFSPQDMADSVLEVNAGMSDAHGWKAGDKIR